MKMKQLLTVVGVGIAVLAHADLTNAATVTAAAPSVTFDFTGFTGAGFSPTPTAGQLNTNTFAVTGFSDGNVNFGGSGASATDFGRGASTGGVTTGGVYAFIVSSNPFVGFQPGGSDFAPGAFFVNIQNAGSSAITDFSISYDIKVLNDQGRSSTFNFAYAVGTVNTTPGSGTAPGSLTYTPVGGLDYTTPVASTSPASFVTVPRSTSIVGLTIPVGQSVVLRFDSDDAAGSGSRDEIGVDNIVFGATFAGTPVPEPLAATAGLLLLGGVLLPRRKPVA